MLFLLSLPASALFHVNSTRKQNYMMNFSRQHGLRHFYNRRRRSLRRFPWRIQKFLFLPTWDVLHPIHFNLALHLISGNASEGTRLITESPSQDQVYATFPHCERMTSDLLSHKQMSPCWCVCEDCDLL